MNPLQKDAMVIAAVVRNALEDFHAEHLSDEQMAELNPLVRNAIYSALWSLLNEESDQKARSFLEFNRRTIPRYWEPPQLRNSLLNEPPQDE